MANFTITFEQYLLTHDLPDVLDLMPNDASEKTFKERFVMRNIYKEIGSETEELFTIHLHNRCHEVVELFSRKIKLFVDNYMELMTRKIALKTEIEYKNDGTNRDVFNPINAEADNTVNKSVMAETNTEQGTREHVYGYFKSNPEMLKLALEIENQYEEALEYMDTLFMVVL